MRSWGDSWPETWFDESFLSRLLYYFGGTLIIVALGMLHDLLARGRLHPVYRVGVPVLLAVFSVAVVLHDSPGWADWVRPHLAGPVSMETVLPESP